LTEFNKVHDGDDDDDATQHMLSENWF